MYYNLIKNYVANITKNDIYNFALKQNIDLKENEVEIIYTSIKEHWEELYNNNGDSVFLIIKKEVRSDIYEKIINLYKENYHKFL